MAAARTMTVTIPARAAEALDESIRTGEFATESEAISDAVQSWQRQRDMIERQKAAIRRDIQASLDDPEPSISIEDVERHMKRRMAAAGKIASDEKA